MSRAIYRAECLNERIEYAARFIASGRDSNRDFNTCFEMSDGDQVLAALCQRIRNHPDGKLARNIRKYIAPSSLEGMIPTA